MRQRRRIPREARWRRLLVLGVLLLPSSVFASDAKSDRDHWAFRPLRRVTPPSIEDPWVRNPVDRFVLAKLREKKLTPAAEADRSTLLRRAHLDLLGFPPAPKLAKSFVNDAKGFPYEKLIDRLLESDHFGERWGRHWLDVARFGESEGSNPEEDRERGHSYKYRDAVIRAFNADLPFDEFVAFQVSGKSLDPEEDAALGKDLSAFPKLGTRLQRNSHPNDKTFHILDDMVSAFGSSFLGLTIGCARCHDHKLDPISSAEYYELTAVFFDMANVSDKVGVNQVDLFREPFLLAGGSWQRPVRKVEPGFVRVLMRDGLEAKSWSVNEKNELRPREALAHWVTDAEKGGGALLARVIVNRLWQHHFGQGIVRTPNDFGQLGELPTHPDLLDWLAGELIRGNWRLKPMHRLLMSSATYRQSAGERWASVDADNKWLWHFRTRRLEAEAIRDSILSASGALITKLYGPSISIGSSRRRYREKPSHWRRSIYLMTPRFVSHPVLGVFDSVNNFQSQGTRRVSTTPNGALFMLNSGFLRKQAEILSERVRKEAPAGVGSKVDWLYGL
ncbi:MAG: DUF1549 and DUF1553 domain-containing protein, partial [Planctomycetota bacterium]